VSDVVRRGSKGLLRDINNSRVLQVIQSRAPVSRAEIAKMAELPPPTVTSIVNDFLRADLVRETDLIRSNGDGLAIIGRRPILLTLNEHAAFVIGVKLRQDGFTLTLVNLGGASIFHTDYRLASTTPAAAFSLIHEEINLAVREAGIDPSKLIGLGIGMPGLIDHVRGVCRYSTLLGWADVDVKASLEDLLQIPVYVDNDVNMVTAAEIAYGAGRETPDFLTVTIGQGIGLGIVLHGEIFRGSFGGAGEFGHTKTGSALRCECGAVGCLEAVASDAGIAAQVSDVLDRPVDIHEAYELARAGNPVVRDVFESAGRLLGTSIGNLLNLFNPQLVIVTGEGTQAGPLLLDPMRRSVATAAFGALGQDTRLIVQEWGDEAWARGAASIVVHEMIKPPIYESGSEGPLTSFLDRALNRANG
jgi:predicted NBD/HSP70 family sugar kinase